MSAVEVEVPLIVEVIDLPALILGQCKILDNYVAVTHTRAPPVAHTQVGCSCGASAGLEVVEDGAAVTLVTA